MTRDTELTSAYGASTLRSRVGVGASPRSQKESPKSGLASLRLEWVVGVLTVMVVCGHVVLLTWWLEDGRDPVPEGPGVTFHLGKNGSYPAGLATVAAKKAEDDADAKAAVDDILASRGHEPRIRRPLADLKKPAAGQCSGNLPKMPAGGCHEEQVRIALETMFQKASGFSAGDAHEVAALEKAAQDAGGPPGFCAEATYGEITVAGLHTVLTAITTLPVDAKLRSATGGSPILGYPFETFIDLGAGTGHTAAAAALMGFAPMALGVELGPQRFALGCQVLEEYKHRASGMQICSKPGLKAVVQPVLTLVRGDAREWPQLAEASHFPQCGSSSVVYMGAECFRDSLVLAIGRAILLSCAEGARIAILGRRFPPELVVIQQRNHSRWLKELNVVRAPTTWSSGGVDVFLYRVTVGGRFAARSGVR